MIVSILPARHRLDVDDYHRMADAGILGKHDRVELIDGELIDMGGRSARATPPSSAA